MASYLHVFVKLIIFTEWVKIAEDFDVHSLGLGYKNHRVRVT